MIALTGVETDGCTGTNQQGTTSSYVAGVDLRKRSVDGDCGWHGWQPSSGYVPKHSSGQTLHEEVLVPSFQQIPSVQVMLSAAVQPLPREHESMPKIDLTDIHEDEACIFACHLNLWRVEILIRLLVCSEHRFV